MNSLINKAFSASRKENRPALLTYTVAGDNTKKKSLEILKSISNYADICELGFPHNTPIADGGQIQTSAYRAIKNGIKINDVFSIAKNFKKIKKNKPIILMGYYNMIYQYNQNRFLEKCNLPIVIKADGLASGKGVYICNSKDEGLTAIKEIFEGKFGLAEKILIEEFLEGEEMSFFIISDGKNYKTFGTAQDHKRVLEGDRGKNTGGMGAYSPSRLENKILNEKILKNIIDPTLKGLAELGTNFKGFLYAGLMIIKGEPYLIEYNVRMGDTECQTILPKLKTDFAQIIKACVNENLNLIDFEWYDDNSLCIVVCSKGYPETYKKNIQIDNLDKILLESNEFIFHAGTKNIDGKIVSNGGRVLNFVVRSKNFKENRNRAINLINQLNWENGFFRSDIAHKVING